MVMSEAATSLDLTCVNAIRSLAIDTIEKANSGHPGLPLGAAPMAYVLWTKFLKHNPTDPTWVDRDRFVLSAGHGSALLYSLLHLTGYDLSIDDLKGFRQLDSKTPGHPELGVAPGVEATTGPLGQGLANAVGMAIAERALANKFNKNEDVVDHWTYALLGDGDMMEGISSEAASLAGHLKLGKLVFMYDANDISLDGPNSLSFTEDVAARFTSFGWQVLHVADGDTDLAAIEQALSDAKAETSRPSLIVVKTTIGFGSPNKAGSSSSHGAPLGTAEAKLTKAALGLSTSEFGIEDDALTELRKTRDRGEIAQAGWNQTHEAWSANNKGLSKVWDLAMAGKLPDKWDAALPEFEVGKKIASRDAGHQAMNAIAATVPNFMGGDADLSCSTKTFIKEGGNFEGQNGTGRNIRYGVREHAMGAVANGIAYHGGLRSFTGTFFVFSDYMRPAMRLAALNHLPVTFVFTHDSIGVGEDGPTHQPIEHLASLRAMPGLVVLRPGDATETNEAWRYAMNETKRPVTLVFSRQGLPTIDRTTHGAAAGLQRGAYILSESKGAMKAVLIATGSEVELALEAQAMLHDADIPTRVVSMPSWELFEEQPDVYRDSILPADIPAKVSVEAGSTFGWSRWTGEKGASVGIDSYGASAPAGLLYEKFGLTAERIVQEVKQLLPGGSRNR